MAIIEGRREGGMPNQLALLLPRLMLREWKKLVTFGRLIMGIVFRESLGPFA